MKVARFSLGIMITAFLTLLTVLMVDTWPVDKHRSKRTIIQMCGLVQFYTQKSCFDYNNYGCFCGLGNKGRKPLDTIDACCLRHDNCYGLVDCWWFYPQWVGYTVHCNNNGCECTDSIAESPCARTTCECDLRFASCLREGRFHSHYSNYNRVLCDQQPWPIGDEEDLDVQEEDGEERTTVQGETQTTSEGTGDRLLSEVFSTFSEGSLHQTDAAEISNDRHDTLEQK